MLKKLNVLLSKKDKIYLLILFIFSIFISLIEVVGIGIIMPFIEVASDFNKIYENRFFFAVYKFFNLSPVSFVVFFGVFLIFFYVLRSILNLFYFYLLARFSQSRYYVLAYRLFENYLGFEYKDFISRNSADFIKNIVNEANYLVNLISSLLFIVSEIFVVVLIYGMLVYINWKMTLLLTIFLGINVVLLKILVSNKIKEAGIIRERMQQKFYRIMSSSFGNFKMIKLRGKEESILASFKEASLGFVRANILSNTLFHFPRLFLEAVGFSLVAFIVIYLVLKYQTDIKEALPILSVFILGLYRLMPSINRIYSNYNNILYYLSSLERIHNDLIYEIEDLGEEEIDFKKEIKLKDIEFEYEENKPILKNVNLVIKKGEKIGIVGESGSGKSTLIDLIIGLYKPKKGGIFIDGVELNEKNIKSWRNKIGYIPQNIYLFDATVAENIAFGEKIDEDRVKEVLKMVNLLEFLEKNHNGIYTVVGENGVKLSGGQKQRVAIARALYHNPEVLVLDEATSALDIGTEEKIMQEIYTIAKDKTVIIVAHRLSTLDGCDRIFEVRNGKLWKK
jgi:ATP-binding cassette subfamily B protein